MRARPVGYPYLGGRTRSVILISATIAAFLLLLSYAASGALPLDDWTVSVISASERDIRFLSISITNTGLTPSVIDSIYIDGIRCPVPREGPVFEINCSDSNGVVILLSEYNEFLKSSTLKAGAPTANKIWPGGRVLLRIIFYPGINPELAHIREIRVRTLSGKTLTINYESGFSVWWSSGLG